MYIIFYFGFILVT